MNRLRVISSRRIGGPHGEVSRDARAGRDRESLGGPGDDAGEHGGRAIIAGNVEMTRSHARVPPFSLSTVRRDAQS